MNQMGGLFELVMVFAILLGFGFIEMRSLRRDKKKAGEAVKKADKGE